MACALHCRSAHPIDRSSSLLICRAQRVPGATEIAKKGTMRVDLQALTVGVALLAMHRWLVRLSASLHDRRGHLQQLSLQAASQPPGSLAASSVACVLSVMCASRSVSVFLRRSLCTGVADAQPKSCNTQECGGLKL